MSPPPVKKHLSPGTWKQGKLALASSLHPQNGLNSKEGFVINFHEQVQSAALSLRLRVHVCLRVHTLADWLEVHNLTVQCVGHRSLVCCIDTKTYQDRFPWLVTENTGNEANIERKCFIFAYIVTTLEVVHREFCKTYCPAGMNCPWLCYKLLLYFQWSWILSEHLNHYFFNADVLLTRRFCLQRYNFQVSRTNQGILYRNKKNVSEINACSSLMPRHILQRNEWRMNHMQIVLHLQ